MRINEILTEAFGTFSGKPTGHADYSVHPMTKREKIGSTLMPLGSIVGAIAGYKLTSDGFWGTAGGVLAGLFLGAIPGTMYQGNKDAQIRISKVKNAADALVNSTPQLKSDFTLFLKSLYRDTPLSEVKKAPNLSRIEFDYDTDPVEMKREIVQWLDHYEEEWKSLAKKYNVSHWVLAYAYEKLFGKSVMESWLDLISKTGEQGRYRTPFSKQGVSEGQLDPYRLERLDPQSRRVLQRMADHKEPGSWLSAAEAYAIMLGLQHKRQDPRGWEQEVQHYVDLWREITGKKS